MENDQTDLRRMLSEILSKLQEIEEKIDSLTYPRHEFIEGRPRWGREVF